MTYNNHISPHGTMGCKDFHTSISTVAYYLTMKNLINKQLVKFITFYLGAFGIYQKLQGFEGFVMKSPQM